ncbi:hypothetical protein, partial [Haloferula sp. A504]|uniref:hypothetical protein n=1 Tax=Haloferula sp. A504 TaxID=3373601 RepID=UPI0031C8F3A6|nr:hypothetical protein [Verrucomicrobiaceae bacterium E54]
RSAAKIVHAFKAWLPRTSSCSRIRKVNAEKYKGRGCPKSDEAPNGKKALRERTVLLPLK